MVPSGRPQLERTSITSSGDAQCARRHLAAGPPGSAKSVVDRLPGEVARLRRTATPRSTADRQRHRQAARRREGMKSAAQPAACGFVRRGASPAAPAAERCANKTRSPVSQQLGEGDHPPKQQRTANQSCCVGAPRPRQVGSGPACHHGPPRVGVSRGRPAATVGETAFARGAAQHARLAPPVRMPGSGRRSGFADPCQFLIHVAFLLLEGRTQSQEPYRRGRERSTSASSECLWSVSHDASIHCRRRPGESRPLRQHRRGPWRSALSRSPSSRSARSIGVVRGGRRPARICVRQRREVVRRNASA